MDWVVDRLGPLGAIAVRQNSQPKPDLRKPVRSAPMTRSRTPLEAAAGKLIAAIQKE